MATTTLEARCNARPTSLFAFILPEPGSGDAVLGDGVPTRTWGGIFNPIVILDDAMRQARGVHYTTLPPDHPYLESQSNLLMAFDPDLLINYGTDNLPPALHKFQHRTFAADRLDWNPWGQGDRIQSYFVDIWPILDDLWDKEFKGISNPRLKIKFLEKTRAESSLIARGSFRHVSQRGQAGIHDP